MASVKVETTRTRSGYRDRGPAWGKNNINARFTDEKAQVQYIGIALRLEMAKMGFIKGSPFSSNSLEIFRVTAPPDYRSTKVSVIWRCNPPHFPRTLGKRFVPITISIDVSWVARGQGRGREEEEEEEGRRNGLELRLESQKHR